MSVKEVHKDSEYVLTCTHKGAAGGLTLHNNDAHFLICGIYVGQAIYNDTDGSNGLITAVTETDVTCTLSGGTNNTWSVNDVAYIYATDEKDSYLSSIDTDRSRGWKVKKGDVLDENGFRTEDTDEDQKTRVVPAPLGSWLDEIDTIGTLE